MAEFIKTRLKLFFLSFFSNKTAREVPKTGFTPVILALLLSFLLLLLGYFGAATAPFASHLDDAEGYTEFIDNAFGAGKLALRVENGKLKSDTVVDTYTSNEDKSLYAINGYDLIADTRRSDMRIAFTQVAKKGNSEITYDEYRALSADEKKSYALETRYTNTELAISQEDVSRFERFLGSEEGAKDELAALDKTAESYADALYALYVKNYYTSVGSILRGSTVPVLRDYYYFTYIVGGKTSAPGWRTCRPC